MQLLSAHIRSLPFHTYRHGAFWLVVDFPYCGPCPWTLKKDGTWAVLVLASLAHNDRHFSKKVLRTVRAPIFIGDLQILFSKRMPCALLNYTILCLLWIAFFTFPETYFALISPHSLCVCVSWYMFSCVEEDVCRWTWRAEVDRGLPQLLFYVIISFETQPLFDLNSFCLCLPGLELQIRTATLDYRVSAGDGNPCPNKV